MVTTFSNNFWRNKRVLLTGHTGFKGSWLALWLLRLGAQVAGISLAPNTTPNLFELTRLASSMESSLYDIRDADGIAKLVSGYRPEVVFHLAAQPLVRAGYNDPLNTFSTNVMGTANLLNALRGVPSVRVAVMVTTDKVYRNREWLYPYREDDPLGGHDPYSASKAASELVICSYRDSFLSCHGVAIASARAGNVIGGGDWSLDRLIPDAVRAWQSGQTLHVRRPTAIRPWQFVLEPLSGYLKLAEKLWDHPECAGAYNFGPETHEVSTVQEVVELGRSVYGLGEVAYSKDNTGPHEALLLRLEISKARTILGVRPRLSLPDAIRRTLLWYYKLNKASDPCELCENDIADYETLL